MTDYTALVALIVAAVALIVAAFQLTQQILATAYVIRKCDQLVFGGLTKGAKRQWHWRQFRFTVKYQAILFSLPSAVYTALGVNSTIQIDSPSREVWSRAIRTRAKRTSIQACYMSLIQDLVSYSFLLPEDICTREESGDRIPDDLTVAPMRIDALTVLLSCIAMGMQVFKYSPTAGEITLAGGVGSVSSSVHPVLGCLLHYSVFSDQPTIGKDAAKRHGRALRHAEGIWANAVFGRFRDLSYRPEMVPLLWLRENRYQVLRENGWPEARDGDGNSDTLGGAACFMAFANVDVYEIAPPSVIRSWTAHFAEFIVKAHHVAIMRSPSGTSHGSIQKVLQDSDCSEEDRYSTENDECSSPYKPLERSLLQGLYDGDLKCLTASLLLRDPALLTVLGRRTEPNGESVSSDTKDPGSYCPVAVMWRLICIADVHMWNLRISYNGRINGYGIQPWADKIVAKSICTLSTVGAPSWGTVTDTLKTWPKSFEDACNEVLKDLEINETVIGLDIKSLHHAIRLYAEFSMLRSAYFTVMVRVAHPLGPGLEEDSRIETALAYMA